MLKFTSTSLNCSAEFDPKFCYESGWSSGIYFSEFAETNI